MSKIEKLIKEKCPNGVKYKKLYEITFWDKKFNGVEKNWQKKIVQFKHTSATQLKELNVQKGNIKLLSTGNFEGFAIESKVKNLLNEGEVITIPSGGSANIKYYKGKFVDSGNILAVSSNPKLYFLKYIYYVLKNKNQLIESYFRGSGVKHPSMIDILKIKIPIPPIEVQKEIVKILDKFSEMKKELELELELRKKQYEYWRRKLYTFNHDIKYIPIEQVCNFVVGGDIPKGNFSKNKTKKFSVPIYSNGVEEKGLYGYTNKSRITQKCVTVSARGTIGYSAIREEPFYPIVRLICVIPKDNLNVRFLKYYFDTLNFKVPTTGIPQLTVPMLKRYKVPVLSLEEQEHIVKILDKFDKLINDISEGIPAEIESRRKQYEYYRNKLLNFEELKDEKN